MTFARPRSALWSVEHRQVHRSFSMAGGMSIDAQLCWPEDHGELSRIMAVADAGPKAAAASCSVEQCCAAVHEASWPGGMALFLPSCCIGWLLLLDVSDNLLLPTDPLRNEPKI